MPNENIPDDGVKRGVVDVDRNEAVSTRLEPGWLPNMKEGADASSFCAEDVDDGVNARKPAVEFVDTVRLRFDDSGLAKDALFSRCREEIRHVDPTCLEQYIPL
jgi:hypothetical protein